MTNQTQHISKHLQQSQENKTLANDFDSVELTPEEIEKATAAALGKLRQEKYAQVKQKEYWDKIKELDRKKILTAEEFRAKKEDQAKQVYGIGLDGKSMFKLDEYNSDIFVGLCQYFAGDPTGPYELSKGICLQGHVGAGKSKLMELFKFNPHQSFVIKSARKVAYEFQKDGADAIIKYSDPIPTLSFKTDAFGQEWFGICFDDIGTENEQKHFGNSSNVVADIILNRYDHGSLKGKTHITTNLTPTQIEVMYGPRVRSRFREMFNQVAMPHGPDRRN